MFNISKLGRSCLVTYLSAVAVSNLAGVAYASVIPPKADQKPSVNITVSSSETTSSFVDPKTGMTLWTTMAKSIDAQSGATSADITGTMHSVTGVFYQSGKPVDSLTADRVTANQNKKTFIASGNVIVRSVADPSSSIHCDTLTWHMDTNMLLGSGKVVFRKGGFTQTGSSFRADTKLKTLTMPDPAFGGKIRAQIEFNGKK